MIVTPLLYSSCSARPLYNRLHDSPMTSIPQRREAMVVIKHLGLTDINLSVAAGY
jgi:hypothetical protein